MLKVFFKISILTIIILTIACKKKTDNVLFSGTVLEPNMQINLSDVKVILSAQVVESGTWSTNYTTLSSTTTDSEGNFNFEVESQRVSNYKISISRTNYFDNYFIISPENVTEGEDYTDTYDIFSESVLEINLENQYPVDSEDHITYSIEGQTFSCSNCCSESENVFTGTNVNEIITCKLPGHQTIKITYMVVKGGNTNIYNISKYITEFETVSVNIFY